MTDHIEAIFATLDHVDEIEDSADRARAADKSGTPHGGPRPTPDERIEAVADALVSTVGRLVVLVGRLERRLDAYERVRL